MQVSGRGPPPRRTGGLPASATPLIGRDAELAALGAAITRADERLITLTGPPGVGKTRLAIAAAAAVGSRFRDGVVFVDLTPVRDPDLVLPEVARALGLRDAPGRPLPDRILTAVAERDLLIVVDNMEHVLDAGPALAALLAECPLLRLLATSRERLHLRGEREYPVAPLELPTPGDVDDLERLVETPSMSMLLHRVRGFQPDFTVTSANAAALAEICIRLDGLPLALELATARLKLFTAGELTFRLRHRMQLLTSGARDGPDRHRTLRAALTWSHDLLVPDERVLFRRLSVFVGGWTLEAAEQVCGVADVVETTASLVDKSLVRRHTPAGAIAEFGLLESIREFAAERLDDQGETEAIRAQHTRYYTAHAVRLEGLIGTGEETLSVWKIGTASNLHAAFQHASDNGRSDQALPLAAVLGWCRYTRGHIGQGQATLDRALTLADAGPDRPPGPALAGALQIAAVLTVARGELDRAEELLDRALRIVERFDDLRRRAFDSAFRGQVARARGDHAGAVAHHDRARALYARLGSAPGRRVVSLRPGPAGPAPRRRRRGDRAPGGEPRPVPGHRLCMGRRVRGVGARHGGASPRASREGGGAAGRGAGRGRGGRRWPRPRPDPRSDRWGRLRAGRVSVSGAVARCGGGAARAARGPAARRGPRRAPCVVTAGAPSAWAR